MKVPISTVLAALMFLMIFGCRQKPAASDAGTGNSKQGAVNPREISGNYVDASYEMRHSGYDWVAVSVRTLSPEIIFISVRSRADIKKPTCTFDTKAYRSNDTTYTTVVDGKPVVVAFTKTTMSIAAERPEDEAALFFFCSGGATVAGTYSKIGGPLDTIQIDRTSFSKILQFKNIGFSVSSKPSSAGEELTIHPFGLSLPNQDVRLMIMGTIVDAEVEDLNSDGFPEILVYTQTGNNKKGDVLGCSVNNGKSMSLFYFPSATEQTSIKAGYEGYDEFSVVESSLCQRFPIYEHGQRTGKMRQVSYELVNGETGRVFRVKDVVEF